MENRYETEKIMDDFGDLVDSMLQVSEGGLDNYVSENVFKAGWLPLSPVDMRKFDSLIIMILEAGAEEHILGMAERKAEYSDCCKFFRWTYNYALRLKETLKKTRSLREMEMSEFKALFDRCMRDMILHRVSVRASTIAGRDCASFSSEGKRSLASLIDHYCRWIFYDNLPKEQAESRLRSFSGLSQERCEVFWEKYLENEEALWRKYSMEKQCNVERELEILSKKLDELVSVLFNE